jgi:peptidoglycan/xylan/chitin deacetylase (PgdA/CDA1 family)
MDKSTISYRNRTNTVFAVSICILILLLVLVLTSKYPDQRVVLLSFDVEPVDGSESVLEVLEIVYRNNVSATFFVTGEYAEQYPEVVELMTGREIGNHGYSHKAFTKMDRDEKISELRKTNLLLENITGQEVLGFRAPYNRIDKETMVVLEEEGFLYDSSIISGWGIFYPGVGDMLIGEIPVSSVLGFPLEDVVFLHYLRMPGLYFYILENKKSGFESYLFHPHHISKYKNEFEEFINHLKKENTIFISHRELIE